MARKKNNEESTDAKAQLAARLRAVRMDRFGERGGPELARLIGVPARTWYNYEVGVTVPAEVLLRFLEVADAEPRWLLHGTGPPYRDPEAPPAGAPTTAPSPAGIEAATLERLVDSVVRQLVRGSLRISWEAEGAGGPGEAPGPGGGVRQGSSGELPSRGE
jgi:hypothetical protein